MKHAYVSLVLPVATVPPSQVIETIDAAMAAEAQAHEVVIVIPHGRSQIPPDGLATRGPITFVTTHLRATPDGAAIAGLARTVGDFVVEWRGPVGALDQQMIAELLEPSNSGVELVEAIGIEDSQASRRFYQVVNSLRPKQAPLRRTIGRVYSRRAVQSVLGASAFEPQLDVLVAELPVIRAQRSLGLRNQHPEQLAQRVSNGLVLLSKGTRFGSAIPLVLAGISATFGIAAALYALAILITRGQTPEGWTTLMVVIGLGQAAILTMLGLAWSRIDALTRGLSNNPDPTADVIVVAPTDPTPKRH